MILNRASLCNKEWKNICLWPWPYNLFWRYLCLRHAVLYIHWVERPKIALSFGNILFKTLKGPNSFHIWGNKFLNKILQSITILWLWEALRIRFVQYLMWKPWYMRNLLFQWVECWSNLTLCHALLNIIILLYKTAIKCNIMFIESGLDIVDH